MAVELRVLGDVEFLVDGHAIDVGHARQRCVLAALLVEANRVVASDQLLDRVWADRPPQRAAGVLSNYVSRLRRAFAVTEDVGIIRRSGGYLLRVDPMAVDLHRFRRLAGQARAAADGQDAADLFDEALSLWRGEAFALLDTLWLNAIRVGLDAERLAVELDRNDLALDRGQHAGLLSGLLGSANTHPLDERLAGQLMLALYRSGRQADALERFQQIQRRLADELGADPSPPLQRLHRQILTADLALAGAAPTVRSATSPIPRQLPAPPGSFVGRTRELAYLHTVLGAAPAETAGVAVITLSGTPGVGKTALAVRFAHQVADRFVDGQLYINLRGYDPTGSIMDPADAARGFLDALGVPAQRIPVEQNAQVGLYRSLLAGKRMLIVLDNARDAEHARPLLPGATGCLVVVTSRNELTGLIANEGARPLTLDLLATTEAHDLLAHRLGLDRVKAEPEAVASIVARCARLPIALAVVAARAASHPDHPLDAVAGQLRDARLSALDGGDPGTDVRAVFSWSYRTLRPATARLFRLLGLNPGPDIGVSAAASLIGMPATQVQVLLAELARAHLVVESPPGRYTQHDLLRAYAIELAQTHDSGVDRHAAAHRMLDHYLHTAHAADRLLNPFRNQITPTTPDAGVVPADLSDAAQAMAWFTTEHQALLDAAQYAVASGFDTHAWQLPATLASFLGRRGRWRDLAAIQCHALAAACRLGDQSAQAHTHRGLARTYVRLARHNDAMTHLRHALDLFGALGDPANEANTYQNIGWALEQQGRHEEAFTPAQTALELYRRIGHVTGQAITLNALGWYHAHLGDHRQAITHCQQALTLIQEVGDRHSEAATWDSLGYAHHHLGHHHEAVECFRQGLALIRTLGDRYNEAEILIHLGDTLDAAGDMNDAEDAWRQALHILDELDTPKADQVRAKLHRSAQFGGRA